MFLLSFLIFYNFAICTMINSSDNKDVMEAMNKLRIGLFSSSFTWKQNMISFLIYLFAGCEIIVLYFSGFYATVGISLGLLLSNILVATDINNKEIKQ